MVRAHGHENQCKGFTRASLGTERCRRYADLDSLYCCRCRSKRHQKSLRTAVGAKGLSTLPMAYRYLLSTALREKLNQIAGQESPLEQLGLYEELALMRAVSQEAITLWDAATHSKSSGELAPAVRAASGELAKQALEDIAKMAERCAKIEGLAVDKLSIAQLGVVIDQIVQLAAEVFGVDDDAVERCKVFALLVNERVKIPTFETKGTSLTPDRDVNAMDNTVPLCIETTVADSNGRAVSGNGYSKGNGHLNGSSHDESL